MKLITVILFLLSFSAFGQTVTEQESTEIERAPVLRCNVVKAPWFLYRAQSAVRKVPKCWTPGCVVRNTRKAEKNFCKAVNVCDSLSVVLKDPCTEDNRLTEEAKAEARDNMKVFLDLMIEKALELVEKIKDEMSQREN